MRRTLSEARKSLISANIGYCQGDIPSLAVTLNQAQEQLIYAGGETGWWGGWYRTVFNVYCTWPYISCPREIARIQDAAVCQTPVNIRNQWYELLEAGAGPRPALCTNSTSQINLLDRGTSPTAYDLPSLSYLRVYYTDANDRGKRVLIDALDQNGRRMQAIDGLTTVEGVYLTLKDPFDTTLNLVTEIKGVQKDETYGDVALYAVDATTGVETLLGIYGPRELVPCLRRYYVENMPSNCCASSTDPVIAATAQVTVMAKMEFIPAWRDTDYLIIGNIPALIEECKSIRHGNMDSKEMKEISIVEHRMAVKHLNDELRHYLGTQQPSVSVRPFGTARLQHQRIGSLV